MKNERNQSTAPTFAFVCLLGFPGLGASKCSTGTARWFFFNFYSLTFTSLAITTRFNF